MKTKTKKRTRKANKATCIVRHANLKPNGKPMGTFVISIDDGFVEYSFDAVLPDSESIAGIWDKIRAATGAPDHKGHIRQKHFE